MSQGPPGAAPPLDSVPVPGDADDTRARHFGELARAPLTIGSTMVLAIVAFIVLASQVSMLAGVGGAIAALLLMSVVVYALASSRAKADFFGAYAKRRGLAWSDARGRIPGYTPLLRKGDERYTVLSLSGPLPGGIDGALSHYTYEEEYRDSEGDPQTTYYEFTLCITEVPEAAPYLHEVFVQRRAGFRFMDSAEDAFRERQRVEHESEEVDRRFEIFIARDDEMNRARQLLSPTFLVWLADHTPENFAFELVSGTLVANVKGHQSSAIELDSIAEATAAIAKRLRAEASE
ncbi:MAG: hypothetical protein H0W09_01495 [Solirubrobacterales bacterium]|nr:hypothetical protein [Solirubrobacterales bacterium]